MAAMLVGYFSYDVIRYIENIPDKCTDDLKIPDVRMIRPKNLVIYDNLKKKIYFIENIYAETKIKNYFEKYHSIQRNFETYEDYSNIKLPINFNHQKNKNQIKSNISKNQFKNCVKKAKEYIAKGDIFQVVLSQRFERKINKTPLEIYNHLRLSNPSPFMFYFNFEDFKIIGSSPEILVRLRDNQITIRPIAGTRPRGATKAQDSKNARDLLKDKKELAEHLMLLDLGRNDVGKVSKINSVKVTESFTIEKYSHVMHIVSNVVGEFDHKNSIFVDQIIGAFFKGKIKTLKHPYHGKISNIKIQKKNKIYININNKFQATRYHSLYVDKINKPKELEITCISEDDKVIMGLKHKLYNIHGVQFHPESIETLIGDRIISNFIKTI